MLSEQIVASFKTLSRFLARSAIRFPAPPSKADRALFGRQLAHGAGLNQVLAVVLGIVLAGGVSGQESSELKKVPDAKAAPAPLATPGDGLPAAIAAARERAELLHDVYASTLVVMHHHYFHSDLAPVPARAMEDIFENMTGLTGGDKARWISVNTKAMSIDHRPSSAFEKKAAGELSVGKQAYELVENGIYQRAAVIPLGMNCIGCHTGRFTTAPKSPRAGLVISIPLKTAGK
jgi:hypothetical protein